jgi:uncharacterized protein involved in tolerance to divalent cations
MMGNNQSNLLEKRVYCVNVVKKRWSLEIWTGKMHKEAAVSIIISANRPQRRT